jgi:hypothetical protein
VGIKTFYGTVAEEPSFIGKTPYYHLLALLIYFSSWETLRMFRRRFWCLPLFEKVWTFLLGHIFHLILLLFLLLERKLVLWPVHHYLRFESELFTTRKTIIGRNVLCGAPKSVCSTKIFMWRIEKYAPHNF